MSTGPQLKSRRSLQATDNKLARLEAVSDWTEEPAQAQAEVVALVPKPEPEKVPEEPVAASDEPSEDTYYAGVRAFKGPDRQASFRLPEEVHSQLKIAVATLNNSNIKMTDVITKGILDQIAVINRMIEKKKQRKS